MLRFKRLERVETKTYPRSQTLRLSATTIVTVLDAYGRCVPDDCESYFVGCNTCSLQKEDPYYDGRMGCTYLYCETPKESQCLKYIGDTEKN